MLYFVPTVGLLAVVALLLVPQVRQRAAARSFERTLTAVLEEAETIDLLQAEREAQRLWISRPGSDTETQAIVAARRTDAALHRRAIPVPDSIEMVRKAVAAGAPFDPLAYDKLIAADVLRFERELTPAAPNDRIVHQTIALVQLWRAEEFAWIERDLVASVSEDLVPGDAAEIAATHELERNALRQLASTGEASIVAALRQASFEPAWVATIDQRRNLLEGPNSIDRQAWLTNSTLRADALDRIVETQKLTLIEAADKAIATANRLTFGSLLGCLLAALIAAVSVHYLRVSLLRPVDGLHEAIDDLVDGRITVREATGSDEMGELETAMTTLSTFFASLEEDAVTVQAALAKGDVGARYASSYPGSWGRLIDGVNRTLDRMEKAVAGERAAEQRRVAVESVLSHNVVHDRTTDLPNFVGLLEWASAQREQGTPVRWAISAVTSSFDVVEAVDGPAVKHRLLAKLAERLEQAVGPNCLLACTEAAEFLVVGTAGLPGMTVDSIAAATKDVLIVDGSPFDARLTIGHAVGIDDVRELLLAAANARRVSWSQPLASSVAFNPAMAVEARHQLEMTSWLETAVDRDEIEVWYQPIVDAESLSDQHFEAVVRGRRRGLLLTPADFVPLAESSGRIVELGDHVRALSLAASCQLAVPNLSINLSPVELGNDQLPDRIATQLALANVAPEHVTIEVTESALIDGSLAVRDRLRAIRDLGVGLSIDDFGSGYSSFGYLRTLPLTTMKIDQTLVRNLDQDPSASAVVHRMIELGHDLGLAVVAEGVETEAELDELRTLNCDLVQGWLIAPARPLSEIKR